LFQRSCSDTASSYTRRRNCSAGHDSAVDARYACRGGVVAYKNGNNAGVHFSLAKLFIRFANWIVNGLWALPQGLSPSGALNPNGSTTLPVARRKRIAYKAAHKYAAGQRSYEMTPDFRRAHLRSSPIVQEWSCLCEDGKRVWRMRLNKIRSLMPAWFDEHLHVKSPRGHRQIGSPRENLTAQIIEFASVHVV
jgi:hypothetical protein